MLTRTMPSVMRALQKSMDSQTLKSFSQALGNCNQPLEHRGDISIQPQSAFIRQGEYDASGDRAVTLREFGPYDPAYLNLFQPVFGDFNPIFPGPYQPNPILPPNLSPGSGFVDGGGGGGNTTINNNLYPTSFSFPTNLNFTTFGGNTNNYFGGNTTIENSVTNNSYTDNSVTTNLSVTNINGRPIQGPSGPPGQPGTDGRDGRNGAPGAPGLTVVTPFPVIFPPKVPPPPPPEGRPDNLSYIDKLPNYDGKLPSFTLQIPVKSYTFDDSTCTLSESTSTVSVTIPEQDVTVTADEQVDPKNIRILVPAGNS